MIISNRDVCAFLIDNIIVIAMIFVAPEYGEYFNLQKGSL